jgi:hypothetical protein
MPDNGNTDLYACYRSVVMSTSVSAIHSIIAFVKNDQRTRISSWSQQPKISPAPTSRSQCDIIHTRP